MKRFPLLTLMLFAALQASAQLITLHNKGLLPKQLEAEIEQQTGYAFFYEQACFEHAKKQNLNADKMPLAALLKQWTKTQRLQYKLIKTVIVMAPLPDSAKKVSKHIFEKNRTLANGKIDRYMLSQTGVNTISGSLIKLGVAHQEKDNLGAEVMVIESRATINGSLSPLIKLDGFDYTRDIDQIDINDVDHIEIIKDASASFYGLGAGNGVIKITTRGAASGGTFGDNDQERSIQTKTGQVVYEQAAASNVLLRFSKSLGLKLIYNGAAPSGSYNGAIPISLNVTEKLNILNAAGLTCTIKGNQLIVE